MGTQGKGVQVVNERENGDRLPERYHRPAAALPPRREDLYALEPLEPRVLLSAAAGVVPAQAYWAYPLVRSTSHGLVVACSLSDDSGVYLTRLGADGAVDTSFGAGGVAVVPGVGRLTQMLVQPDGKLLVLAGGRDITSAWHDGTYMFRLNDDGRPDDSFGIGGCVQVPDGGDGLRGDIALMPDGRVIVAEAVYVPADESIEASFFRFQPDGHQDRSYGNDGVADIHGDWGAHEAWGLRVGASGEVSAALGAWGEDGLVAGTDAAGIPDTRLGSGGVLVMPGVDWWKLSVVSDGIMFITDMTPTGMRVERRGPDGQVDRAFGVDGSSEMTAGGRAWVACSGPEMPDGRVIWPVYRPDITQFSLMAMNADGSTDLEFGGGAGLVNPPAPDGFYLPQIADTTLDDDNRIVTATFFVRAVDGQPDEVTLALSRFAGDGALDSSFGTGGLVFFDGAEINATTVEPPVALREPAPVRTPPPVAPQPPDDPIETPPDTPAPLEGDGDEIVNGAFLAPQPDVLSGGDGQTAAVAGGGGDLLYPGGTILGNRDDDLFALESA
jgi:uncharacterized delta-60 repeat protein